MIKAFKLKPYVKKELAAAKQAQQEKLFQLAALRYERALILAEYAPRQRVSIYLKIAWFQSQQKQMGHARDAISLAGKHLFKKALLHKVIQPNLRQF